MPREKQQELWKRLKSLNLPPLDPSKRGRKHFNEILDEIKAALGGDLHDRFDLLAMVIRRQREIKTPSGLSFADVKDYTDKIRGDKWSYPDLMEKLMKHPRGHRYCEAVYMCDADICNGGFGQLFYNSTGTMSVVAIEGLERMGYPEQAELIRNALYLESRQENQVAEFIPPGYFDNYTPNYDSFEALEDKYYACGQSGYFEDEIVEYIGNCPEDFAQPDQATPPV